MSRRRIRSRRSSTKGSERVLAVLPPFHIYALTVNMLLGIRIGAELILHTRFDTAAVVKDICGEEGHGLSRRADDVRRDDQPSRRRKYRLVVAEVLRLGRRAAAAGGRSSASQNIYRLPTHRRLGHDRNVADRHIHAAWTACARPARAACRCRGITIKLADVDDPLARCRSARRGEMCIARSQRHEGLLERPDATAAIMTKDGFFRTGDVGHGRGRLRLHRRPHQGHAAVRRLQRLPAHHRGGDLRAPGVDEVSVIGIHDDYRGQSPKAFVKLKTGAAASRWRK